MRRKTRDFGRLRLVAIFLFVAVLLPKFINVNAVSDLGSFARGETGIKLCAIINGGTEDELRFSVSSNRGFQADVIVAKDSCKNIQTTAANYTIRQKLPQEYAITSVTGGTVSADNTAFAATAAGQYAIVYIDTFSQKGYLHNYGYTNTSTSATAVEVSFDANGGTGSMANQNFGLNAMQNLSANTFTREKHEFTGWNSKADGTGESYTDGQALTFATGGELKLYAQWKLLSQEAVDVVASQVNNLGDYQIDFTRKAIVSDDIATANGNGVNTYTENGQTIYYYRGQVANNNVIWAGKCWKIIRTTVTGGTKMIYNGEVDTAENFDGDMVPTNTCTATGTDTQITYNNKNTFTFSMGGEYTSPADVGYMFGKRLEYKTLSADSTSFTFANDVTHNADGTYTLDTSDGQSISGTYANQRTNATTRYHYFCTDGATSCDSAEIGYIYYGGTNSRTIYYLNIGGYDDIEAAKAAMFDNVIDSNAKFTIEAWFEAENLDGHIAGTRNYEDDLEDAVFCNDRSYYSGALKSKDAKGNGYNYHGADGRNNTIVDGNYHPSLDCANKNDAFTKNDTMNGNGKLAHKVGLITADELTMAGSGWMIYDDAAAYLDTGYGSVSWSASPSYFISDKAYEFSMGRALFHYEVNRSYGLRPLVSLKSGIEFLDNGADGTAQHPFIVE